MPIGCTPLDHFHLEKLFLACGEDNTLYPCPLDETVLSMQHCGDEATLSPLGCRCKMNAVGEDESQHGCMEAS